MTQGRVHSQMSLPLGMSLPFIYNKSFSPPYLEAVMFSPHLLHSSCTETLEINSLPRNQATDLTLLSVYGSFISVGFCHRQNLILNSRVWFISGCFPLPTFQPSVCHLCGLWWCLRVGACVFLWLLQPAVFSGHPPGGNFLLAYFCSDLQHPPHPPSRSLYKDISSPFPALS